MEDTFSHYLKDSHHTTQRLNNLYKIVQKIKFPFKDFFQ